MFLLRFSVYIIYTPITIGRSRESLYGLVTLLYYYTRILLLKTKERKVCALNQKSWIEHKTIYKDFLFFRFLKNIFITPKII